MFMTPIIRLEPEPLEKVVLLHFNKLSHQRIFRLICRLKAGEYHSSKYHRIQFQSLISLHSLRHNDTPTGVLMFHEGVTRTLQQL